MYNHHLTVDLLIIEPIAYSGSVLVSRTGDEVST